ncbi:hypothetical protein FHG64_03490 [Antarcticibacterium flavum]|uniref:Uncharacterized protein n=1 Tax=Antarcticibacterium flavum TaxID=2058175 RepID=A0A5B7X1H0_9FLAO|nr:MULTISPECIES: hypothetical protein [Antarcticibacterium]MCM4158674.1 hypothetical protein [Antarcticibacterium sp. W02-3]QCY68528.1 hypothetical protein FHG64_03490 [Antarcticibacterium flavum]
MKHLFLFAAVILSFSAWAQDQNKGILSSEIQIKTAVLPLPEEQRETAKVYGYDRDGKMVVLREGTGNMVCLADDPTREGISVSCYSKKLEPFMARGRALSAEGKGEMEKREIRQREAEEGKLELPDAPSMTYIFSGTEDNYDRDTGELKDGRFRYVIYIPYATTESTGLPDKPHYPGMPWLMDPGTHRAHIMITPPQD